LKKDLVNFKSILLRDALKGIENGDDIYIKYEGKYLICDTYSNSSDSERRGKIVFKKDDTLEHSIGLFESANYEFYKEGYEMSKNYVRQFRLDNGIKLNGEIKLLKHIYSNHTWMVDDTDVFSLGVEGEELKILTYSDDSEVMAGLLNGKIKFEVPKEYKQISLESALISIRNGKEIYTKLYIDEKYFLCKVMDTGQGICVIDDKGGIEALIGVLEVLDYEFYKEAV